MRWEDENVCYFKEVHFDSEIEAFFSEVRVTFLKLMVVCSSTF